jgi:hypothetical protein
MAMRRNSGPESTITDVVIYGRCNLLSNAELAAKAHRRPSPTTA